MSCTTFLREVASRTRYVFIPHILLMTVMHTARPFAHFALPPLAVSNHLLRYFRDVI
jgi:hypothetical protein